MPPIDFNTVILALTRECNQLIVYKRSVAPVTEYSNHILLNTYTLVKVSQKKLSITNLPILDVIAGGWTKKDEFTTKLELQGKKIHSFWCDDDDTPYIVIGVGDNRDRIMENPSYNLLDGVVFSSIGPNLLSVHYK